MKLRRNLSLSLPLLLVVSCTEAPRVITQPAAPAPTAAHSTNSSSDPAGAMNAPPLAPGAEKAPLPASHPPIGNALKALVFKAPAGWVSETPASPMRREQYRLSKQGTDAQDATVTVSVLGATDGGPVEGNLTRWAGQFAQPDGKPSRDALKQSNRKLGAANVIDLDITGTYTLDERAMGGTKTYNEPNWRMLMSWIQSPTGNYYVKLIGPAATVAHWESSFRTFVDSSANE